MTRDARSRIRSVQDGIEEQLAADPLRDSFVWWDEVTKKDERRLRAATDRATVERDMQKYLEQQPEMLIQHLGGGHGRWVIPQTRSDRST
jgi:hypothetical protein